MSLLDAFSVNDRAPLCEPFFRWTGSKADLRSTITRRMPERIINYLEPFTGGGAVALALLSEPGRIAGAALLSDTNAELVITYACVRDVPERVISELQLHIDASCEAHYEKTRAEMPPAFSGHDVTGNDDDALRAARFLYLLGAGWHGLWRENSSGGMNTPYGHGEAAYSKPERIRAASRALTRARFSVRDFESTINLSAGAGDLVYADPPYVPRTITASFTGYGKAGFNAGDHERLNRACVAAAARGAISLVSNSDTPETRRLYAGGKPEIIAHNYKIGAASTGSDPVHEVLIRYSSS